MNEDVVRMSDYLQLPKYDVAPIATDDILQPVVNTQEETRGSWIDIEVPLWFMKQAILNESPLLGET